MEKYLKKTATFAHLLQCLPFLKAVILNGSLARCTAEESSDIDLLIVAKSGRLYTVRLLINIMGLLSGQKRSKNEDKSHAGKFCFNYFLTDSYLKIPTGRGNKIDRYCAMNYSQSVFVWGDEKLFNKFIKINKKLFLDFNYYPATICPESLKSYFPVGDSKFLSKLRKTQEFIFGGWLGDWLERRFKYWQIRAIERDGRTKKFPDLIVYNDQEARFHPPKKR